MKQEVFLFQVDGVSTNFRMPDVLSIGLGGGSHVKHHENDKVGVASCYLVSPRVFKTAQFIKN